MAKVILADLLTNKKTAKDSVRLYITDHLTVAINKYPNSAKVRWTVCFVLYGHNGKTKTVTINENYTSGWKTIVQEYGRMLNADIDGIIALGMLKPKPEVIHNYLRLAIRDTYREAPLALLISKVSN